MQPHAPPPTRQGILGDCWFLSAVAVLARKAAADATTDGTTEATADGTADVPGSQARLQQLFAYCAVRGAPRGRCTLQFWKRGAWRRVTIDDRLPCVDGAPLYARSASPHEMWVALLEKAYAKLHGSYEHLVCGFADYAMADLSGCPPQRVRIDGASHGSRGGGGGGGGGGGSSSSSSSNSSGNCLVGGGPHVCRP